MDTWTDRSPHQSGFITANGLKLHYLDWDGQGPALLFLTGLGDSAHIFDDLAPQFTDRFRVLGLTRRGHGQSEKPANGYAISLLVEDLRQFMDRMGLERATLVGHSIAGEEMARFAAAYPERVDRLVYLDAAVNRPHMRGVIQKYSGLLEQTQPVPPETDSYAEYREAVKTGFFGFWSEAQEANLRETLIRSPEGKIVDAGVPGEVYAEIMSSLQPADYGQSTAPVLSFYAWGYLLPAGDLDAEMQQKFQEFLGEIDAVKQAQKAWFLQQAPHGQVVELPDTHHHCFLHRPEAVAQAMRRFLVEG